MSLREDAGVLKTDVGCGIVTRAALAGMCIDVAQTLDGEAPAIYFADFRRPLWATSEAELNSFYIGQDPALIAPAAMLVTAENYGLFRRHAWAMAQLGIMRKAFTDESSAFEWCRMRLRLAGHLRTAPLPLRPCRAGSAP